MGIPIVLFVGSAVLYSLFIAFKYEKLRKEIFTYLILCLLISVLFYLLTDSQTVSISSNYGIKRIVSKLQQFLWMFFPLLLGFVFVKRSNKGQKIVMGILLIVIISVILFQTLIAISANPDAARSFHTDEVVDEEMIPFIGNYYFVYLIPFLIIQLVDIFQVNHKIAIRVLVVFLIIVLFDFLLKAQFTLSILISFIGLLLVLGIHIRGSAAKLIYAFLMLIIIFFVPSILSYSINHIESVQIVDRLKEIHSFFITGVSDGYNLGGRLDLYKSSINAFFQSPIWGNRYLSFDGHATLLTIPADLGLLGAVPFYYMLFHSRSLAVKFLSDKSIMNVIFIMLLLMGLTNPIHSSSQISFGVWFITPYIVDLLNTLTQFSNNRYVS